ncbi:ATP-sensitive inward rectifier potassium channel 15 [Brachyhypopomus gauderio]|uniref:ATP-sensitive inward rectifier potassium channel 15 n=1 Tax=Brachyhypopomus gauderio TaxID=698409 RepID=UPI0040430149
MSVSTQRRVVSKEGHNNVHIDNVEGMVQIYLHDIWTTVLDMKWRYKLTLFVSTFFTTWFIFGVVFYLIGMKNGDIDIVHSSNHTPCVTNVASLMGAYLFSLESQATIGYGFRHISEECPLAILALVAQVVFTSLAEIFVTGAFLAKLARSKKRAESVRFSRYAVVCVRQGKACVMVRVANMRQSLLVQCQLIGKLFSPYITEEGEKTLLHQAAVSFQLDCGDEFPFLGMPLTFYHELDESSPLAGLTAESLKTRDFELVLSLSATTESTASFCQCRTSYTPQEFLWDCEFEPLLYIAPRGRHIIDFGFFDKVQASMEPSLLQNPQTEKLRLEDEYRRE